MSTHNIAFSKCKENHPKLGQICSFGIFSNGLKNEFETAMVNESSVFEPLKVYCMYRDTDMNMGSEAQLLLKKK